MKLTTRKYFVPFVLITLLFFLWGFARAILDVLNLHFRERMDISITESSLIQVTTFLAYFLTAIPAGLFISKFGYRRGVVSGLLLYALGSFLFIPCSEIGTLPAFLSCLFIIGVGLTFLETSANPYATELGPAESATSRLNLSQSFNGLGSMLAPVMVGGFLFSGGHVTLPYIVMGFVVLVVALLFSFVKLPDIKSDDQRNDFDDENEGQYLSEDEVEYSRNIHKYNSVGHKGIWTNSFMLGLGALLAYEVSEISINSYFVLFLTGQGYADNIEASQLLSLALGIFMVGRFIGAWVMQKVRPAVVLLCCAAGSVVCMLSVLFGISVAVYALVFNFACESIMFPTIFSLALEGMNGQTKKRASSLLMMTPVGGCAFLLMGLIADSGSLTLPFFVPLAGFIVVLYFALRHK